MAVPGVPLLPDDEDEDDDAMEGSSDGFDDDLEIDVRTGDPELSSLLRFPFQECWRVSQSLFGPQFKVLDVEEFEVRAETEC